MGSSCGEKPESPYPDGSWFRTGTKNRRVIYLVTPDHPHPGFMVGSMDTDELAEMAVNEMNRGEHGDRWLDRHLRGGGDGSTGGEPG